MFSVALAAVLSGVGTTYTETGHSAASAPKSIRSRMLGVGTRPFHRVTSAVEAYHEVLKEAAFQDRRGECFDLAGRVQPANVLLRDSQ